MDAPLKTARLSFWHWSSLLLEVCLPVFPTEAANNLSPSLINVPHNSGQATLIISMQEGWMPRVQQYGEKRRRKSSSGWEERPKTTRWRTMSGWWVHVPVLAADSGMSGWSQRKWKSLLLYSDICLSRLDESRSRKDNRKHVYSQK